MTQHQQPFRIERANSAQFKGIAALFKRANCPCHCQYFGFAGDHREWQIRCANDEESNRLALSADLSAERLTALVAASGEETSGWLRIDRPEALHKTYDGRLYRGLPCFAGDRRGVWAVACFLVDPEVRRQGVASALLEAGLELARQQGAVALEAFPRGADGVSDEEQWTGPLSLYERAGFRATSDFKPYPVMRITL